MQTLRLLRLLESFPLFTVNTVAKIINKHQTYTRTLLSRLHKQNIIFRLERGKYTLHHDPLIFASHIITPSYLGLWTALRYYHMTQQQPTSFFVLCSRKRKPITLSSTTIIFVPTQHLFGYRKERYADFDIFIADPEKTLIDSLLYKLPLADIAFALDHASLDFHKLSRYALQTRNISLIKRLGYLLENKQGKSYGLRAMDANYVPLDYLGTHKKGKKNKLWKLVINTDL